MDREKITVLISLDATEQDIETIRKSCPETDIRIGPYINNVGHEMPVELMKGADILLCELPPSNFDDFDKLKWIQLTSAGYGQVLDFPVLERGIRVTNGKGVFDISIAEWVIMMILVWHRRLLEMLQNQRNKKWDRAPRFQRELRGSVVGFYGYGGISRQATRLAKAMGLETWMMSRDGKVAKRPQVYCVQGTGDPDGILPDRLFSVKQKEEFFAGVDYLVIGIPLTPATKGIIGEKELRLLKPSAVLINPARAQIIDEQAYIKSLTEGWIRGSSLDVHYAYPLPPEHPLWSMPNIIMTPHISGSCGCPHFLERVYDIFSENLRRYCNGESLLNELTVSQLKGE